MGLSQVTINAGNGDFNPGSLAKAVNTDAMNDVVVRSWIDRAGKLGLTSFS
jgi:ATP-dependent helicase IRC3